MKNKVLLYQQTSGLYFNDFAQEMFTVEPMIFQDGFTWLTD